MYFHISRFQYQHFKLIDIYHSPNGAERVLSLAIPQNADLTCEVGISHRNFDHKAVKLRIRQQLCARRTNGVLGCKHQKRRRQRVTLPVHRYMQLLHSLQQGRLGLAGGAVDLIRQKQICHNSAAFINKATALLVVHGVADDIRRNSIRGELNSACLQSKHLGKGHCCGSFSDAGHILHKHVTACQNRH